MNFQGKGKFLWKIWLQRHNTSVGYCHDGENAAVGRHPIAVGPIGPDATGYRTESQWDLLGTHLDHSQIPIVQGEGADNDRVR